MSPPCAKVFVRACVQARDMMSVVAKAEVRAARAPARNALPHAPPCRLAQSAAFRLRVQFGTELDFRAQTLEAELSCAAWDAALLEQMDEAHFSPAQAETGACVVFKLQEQAQVRRGARGPPHRPVLTCPPQEALTELENIRMHASVLNRPFEDTRGLQRRVRARARLCVRWFADA